jgi:hypothetical protein
MLMSLSLPVPDVVKSKPYWTVEAPEGQTTLPMRKRTSTNSSYAAQKWLDGDVRLPTLGNNGVGVVACFLVSFLLFPPESF